MSTQTYADERSGGLGFAAIVMFSVGFFRIISAIAFFADSAKINNLANGLFSGHTWGWGLWDLLIATAAILAGFSLLAGGGFGRVVGNVRSREAQRVPGKQRQPMFRPRPQPPPHEIPVRR